MKRNYRTDAARSIKRTAKRAAYSVATGAAVVSADRAVAEPIAYIPPGGPASLASSDFESIVIDLNSDGTNDFSISFNYVTEFDYMGKFLIRPWDTMNRVLVDGLYVEVVPPGGAIGPNGSDFDGGYRTFDHFAGLRGYAGVVFDIPGGSPHYGYLDIDLDETGHLLTLYGGAFESLANTSITAVPEPGALALLAAGAAGLAVWRRRS